MAIAPTILASAVVVCCTLSPALRAQPPAPPARQIGTVETISANGLTLKSDDGKTSTVNVQDGARILQIAPGSTNLKSAEVIALSDISVGDRILVTGQAATEPATFQASRVILMKSIDIAKKHADEAQDWEKNGSGGLVSAVDPATGTITITARGAKIAVQTTSATLFRRYASDSVKFEDAKPSTLAQIQPGDQMRVRGKRSESATGTTGGGSTTIQAVEIVSGSFLNLAGTIATLDPAASTLTLKDLATKKTYTVALTANSNLRYLPPEDARKFAARERASTAQPGATPAAGSGRPHPGSESPAKPHAAPPTASSTAPSASATAPASDRPAAPAELSLSQLLPSLAATSLADLRVGDALMIVASQPAPGSNSLTAVTVLAGVEPILTATPTGRSGPSLSPWNVSGAPDGGGM